MDGRSPTIRAEYGADRQAAAVSGIGEDLVVVIEEAIGSECNT